MKKILLAGTAIVGAAILASPAQADLKIDLGGHFRGYAVFSENDESSSVATGTGTTSVITGASLRNFDFRRDMEVHFTGETTTDSGLTVGVHAELEMGNEGPDVGAPPTLTSAGDDFNQLDEAYMYFSGGWGRVNFGSEDGAAYLLQVAAPSADSNIDGMRVYVQAFNTDVWDDGLVNGSTTDVTARLDYDNADFRDTDRLTYLTPKWNGFQAGASYAPEAGQNVVDGAFAPIATDDDVGQFENLWEVAARWDGEFEGFGISLGAGYATAGTEADALAGTFGSDNLTSWDAGVNVSFNDFSIGAAYLTSDTGTSGANADLTTWVVGAAWDNGPYHLGLSYNDTQLDSNAYGAGLADDLELNRWAVGGGYTYGPGMTFRGSVAMLDVDNGNGNNGLFGGGPGLTATPDPTQYQIAIGTDINF